MSQTEREGEARRNIEAAIARRMEVFALSHLAWTAHGYTVQFRLGVVDIVRTAVEEGVFDDDASARMDRMLDGVRRDFLIFNPGSGAPRPPRQADDTRAS